MNEFLTSNEWHWRLARTIVQGILGVVVANIDVLMGAAAPAAQGKRPLALDLDPARPREPESPAARCEGPNRYPLRGVGAQRAMCGRSLCLFTS